MLWWVGISTARPRTRAFTVSNMKVTNCGLGLNYSTGEHPFQPPRTSQTVFLAVSQQEWELNYPTSLDYCCHLILRLRLAVGPGNVMFQNGDHGELSHSEISGGSRGVWLERNEGLAVHHILIHNNYGPSIDVDNGNNGVLLYSNIMEHTDAYGMWLELSTTDCWVFNNTIRNASFAIVAVSSAGHHFIGNTLLDSKHGTFVFGVAAKGKAIKGDIFAGNTIKGNQSTYAPGSQGDLEDNWFFGNEFVGVVDDAEVYERYLGDSASRISIFDYSDKPAAIYGM